MFCGPPPGRRRLRSAWNTTSSTQCRRFSTGQWRRTACALRSSGGSRGWLAQALDPGGEAVGKERVVGRVNDIVEGVVAGHTSLIGQQAPQGLLVHLAPSLVSTKSSAPACRRRPDQAISTLYATAFSVTLIAHYRLVPRNNVGNVAQRLGLAEQVALQLVAAFGL